MQTKTVDPKAVQTLNPYQWFRLIVIYLLIPLVLLVSGWDPGWWQAWVYSFLVIAAGVGGRIWAERRHPGLLAERSNFERSPDVKPWDKVLAPLMAFSVSFPLFIPAGLDHHFGWSPVFPVWLNILGLILIALQFLVENHAWPIGQTGSFPIYFGVLFGLGATLILGALLLNLRSSVLVMLSVAALLAILLALQERALRHRRFSGIVRALPPLTLTESLLFQLIGVGFVLLTVTLISGILFVDTRDRDVGTHRGLLASCSLFVAPPIFLDPDIAPGVGTTVVATLPRDSGARRAHGERALG